MTPGIHHNPLRSNSCNWATGLTAGVFLGRVTGWQWREWGQARKVSMLLHLVCVRPSKVEQPLHILVSLQLQYTERPLQDACMRANRG